MKSYTETNLAWPQRTARELVSRFRYGDPIEHYKRPQWVEDAISWGLMIVCLSLFAFIGAILAY